MCRHACSIAAGVLLATAAAPARADGGDDLRLTWSAPAGCPSTDAVRSASLRGVDTRAAAAAGAKAKEAVLEADALVEQKQALWTVRLRTRRGGVSGEREIHAATCDGVADATALVLALALVPPGSAPDAPLRNDAPAAAPASAARDDAGRGETSRRRGDPAHALALGVSAALDSATLPEVALGGAATLAWTAGRFRVEADGRRWAGQSRTVTAASFAGARFTMGSIGGRAAWAALRMHGFELSPCAGADVHVASATGFGADANYEGTGTWTSVTAGALGRLSITPWLALRGRVEAAVPLARPAFVIENEGTVHRPPTLGVAASFGAEALFF